MVVFSKHTDSTRSKERQTRTKIKGVQERRNEVKERGIEKNVGLGYMYICNSFFQNISYNSLFARRTLSVYTEIAAPIYTPGMRIENGSTRHRDSR